MGHDRPTLLIIASQPEDHLVVRNALGDDFRFIETDLGQSGLELARTARPACILIDYRLPDMDGLGFITQLGDEQKAGPALLVLTTRSDLELAVACIRRGAHDLLIKDNLDAHELRSAIANCLERLGMRCQSALQARETRSQLELERYRQIVDTSNENLVFLDRDLRIRIVNPAYAELRQSTPQALQGRLLREVVGEPVYARIEPELLATLAGEHRHFRFEGLYPDGRHRYLDVDHAPFWADGEVQGVVASLHDVTEAQEAQLAIEAERANLEERVAARTAELVASDERLRAIADSAQDAIIMIDATGSIEFWNDAAERTFGYPREDALGQDIHTLVGPAGLVELGHWKRTLAEPFTENPVEVSGRHRDGRRLVLELSLSAVSLQGSEYTIGILREISARKAAEHAIRRYQEIVRSSSDAIVTITLEGRITTWNPAAERIFGYPGMEMIGQSISRLIPPELREEETKILTRLDSGEASPHFESQRLHKDGTLLDMSITVSPIRNENGRLIGASKIARDITANKRNERRVHELLSEIQDLYHKAPSGYHSIDARGVILGINDTELAWLGYAREEIVGQKRITDLMTADSAARFETAHADFIAKGRSEGIEFEFVRKDGSILVGLVSATAVTDKQGRFVRSRSVMIDYSRLRQQQATLRTVLAAAPIAVRVASLADRRLRFMNRTFSELIQQSPEAAGDIDVGRYYVDPEVIDGITQRLLRGETLMNQLVELHLPEQPQQPHIWAMGSYMIIDYEGEPAVLAWLFDVTSMREAKLAAERANRAKSVFLAHMSHEIRTPMNGILGLAEVALHKTSDPELREDLGQIRQSAGSLLGILNDVLDQAKIEAGELRLESAPFALATLHETLYALFSEPAAAKGLALSISTDESVPRTLVGDVLRLQQVLANLVANAVKFTEQGEIRLNLQRLDETPEGVLLRWSVMDTGIGMDTDTLERLFKPFSQGDDSIARRYGGTGLGLTISWDLVHLMGGVLEVISTPGQGTRFAFELRLGRGEDQPEARETQTLCATNLAGACILVAEDQPINQRVIGDMLRLLGVNYSLADTGETALAYLAKDPFDAVLMDIQMPVMDGLTATRRIRDNPDWADLPVIALTAGVTEAEREQIQAAGMNALLAKPLTLDALRVMLATWLPAIPDTDETVAPKAAAAPPEDAAPADTLTLPGFDLRPLLAITGSTAQVRERLGLFAETVRDDAEQIKAALESGAHQEALTALHRLKGLAGTMGANALFDATRILEERLQQEADPTPALTGFSETHAEALDQIDTLQQPAEPTPSAHQELAPEDIRALASEVRSRLRDELFISADLLERLSAALSAEQRTLLQAAKPALERLDYPAAEQLLEPLWLVLHLDHPDSDRPGRRL